MSRIGLTPVEVPSGTEVKVEGQVVSAKGKIGEGSLTVVPEVAVSLDDGKVTVKPRDDSKQARSMWGTTRSLIDNLVTGVSEGFTYTLEIQGVGYRAAVQDKTLDLQLGYSEDVHYPIPDGITINCERPTLITISGANKQRVGQVAAEIRGLRPPEPYKGKGVRHADEYVLRKEGKKK